MQKETEKEEQEITQADRETVSARCYQHCQQQRAGQRREAVIEDETFQDTLRIQAELKAQCKKIMVLRSTLESALSKTLLSQLYVNGLEVVRSWQYEW